LFPNWKNFNVLFFKEEAKDCLKRLKRDAFLLKSAKTPKSHRIFLLYYVPSRNPDLFLKLFIPRPFKKNRVKTYLKTFLELKKLDVPLLEPLFIFWENSCFSLLKKSPFYGGIAFSYLKEGFLTFESASKLLPDLVEFLFLLHEKGVYLRDSKFYNFYFDKSQGFKVFDLDGVKVYKHPLNKEKRLKELATLAMTLEWEGLATARNTIWDAYSRLYPSLDQKDWLEFEKFISIKKKRREAHLKNITEL